ncbi:hypothetical protein [Streptomyces drozdowiczii]|nr:hypothetical protein [Streptomyces drozdowiczii]
MDAVTEHQRTRDAPPRPYDCRMRAGGRRPWPAMRRGQLVASP